MAGNKLRIVHISTVHSDSDTRIFEKECRSLAEKDHEVSLIIPADRDEVRKGINIKALPILKDRFRRMTFGTITAARNAFSENGDINHLHDPELLPLGLLLRATGRRVVYDMHENLPEQIRTKHWIHPLIRKALAAIISIFERMTLNRMAVIMAESSYAIDYDWVKKSQIVLNLPKVEELIKLENATQRGQKDEFLVGYIGGVSRERGILTVVEALKGLRSESLPIKFKCVGNKSKEVAADQIYQEGIKEGWIISPGRMPPNLGWPLIARCHLGIALLKPIGNYVGSYPTKMFEYMAIDRKSVV